MFALEAGDVAMAGDCPYDSVTFYSHEETSMETEMKIDYLGRFCGVQTPGWFITPSNSLLVVFESDSANTGAGFRLYWRAVSELRAAQLLANNQNVPNENISVPPTAPPSEKKVTSSVSSYSQPACKGGVILTSLHGTVKSPGFGKTNYPKGYSCLWVLRPQLPSDEIIQSVDIRFYDFNVQGSLKCESDVVEIIFYDPLKRRHRGKYCDSNRPLIGEALVADTEFEVNITFRSNHDVQARGFQLGYLVKTKSVAPKEEKIIRKQEPEIKVVEGTCGTANFQKPAYMDQIDRVVGGELTQPGAWPFVAELLYRGYHLCGASILNEQWLLTAAHCFRQGRRHKNGWQIAIGRHSIKSTVGWDHKTAIFYPAIEQILLHNQYGKTPNPKAYDIALIKLADKIDFSNSLAKPVCLASRDSMNFDQCYVIGWGSTQRTGAEGFLNQAKLPILNNLNCKRMNFYYSTLVDERMICAGYEEGRVDSCQGDSGG